LPLSPMDCVRMHKKYLLAASGSVRLQPKVSWQAQAL